MNKSLFSRMAVVLLCLAVLLCAVGMTSCAAEQTPLLTLEGQTISVNHFELLLTRLKATNSGFSQWSSVADLTTGETYNDIAKKSQLESAKLTLAALVLFEQENLSLPQSAYDEIDRNIQDMINADADGSKSGFNGVLSAFGVNIDILREVYIKEAKATYVKDFLFGEDKLTDTVRQQFIDENTAAFKQIAVRAWEYVYQTDSNGDIIYYKTGENNARVNNIAYDEINGYPRPVTGQETSLDPTYVTDSNGDVIYYESSGSDRIAYDKETGVPAHKTGTDGQKLIREFTQAERNDLKNEVVAELLTSVENGTMTNFEEKMAAYYDGLMDTDEDAGELSFLYTIEDHYVGVDGSEMLTDMADALREMKTGEVRMVESEAGFHIIMKYDVPSDAATNTAYAGWFETLDEIITNRLFTERCAELVASVAVNEEAWKATPGMATVNANFYY